MVLSKAHCYGWRSKKNIKKLGKNRGILKPSLAFVETNIFKLCVMDMCEYTMLLQIDSISLNGSRTSIQVGSSGVKVEVGGRMI